MAFVHGKDTKIYVNGYDLTGFLNSISLSAEAGTAETTTFGASSKAYLAGLKDATLSAEGLFEGAVDAVDVVLNAALGAQGSIWTYLIEGDVIGKPGYGMAAVQTSYELDSPLDDICSLSAEAQSTVGLEPILVHQPRSTVVASGQATAINHGSTTTAGGVAYLQVPNITTITNLSVLIEDSADGNTGWATILTFAGVTASRARQRVAITGTVRAHTRARWVFTGTGSAQFHVGFGRR